MDYQKKMKTTQDITFVRTANSLGLPKKELVAAGTLVWMDETPVSNNKFRIRVCGTFLEQLVGSNSITEVGAE